jgi:hypothetical protein
MNNKRLRSNAKGETKSLSFRNLSHLCIVSEDDIQKQGSPIESNQVILKTAEYSMFKFLLTGVDDSALIAESKKEELSQDTISKIAFIEELLADYKKRIGEDDINKLKDQLAKLEASITEDKRLLNVSEKDYQNLVNKRNDIRRRYENGTDRHGEIAELLARFKLLDDSYQSDLDRLEGIREAGSLVEVLSPQVCPLCGAEPAEQHLDKNCDGNLKANIEAADAESIKIKQLRRELEETVSQLKKEAGSFDRLMPKLYADIEHLETEIQKIVSGLTDKRVNYSDLIETRADLHSKILLWSQIDDLEEMHKKLQCVAEETETQSQKIVDLSSTTLDQFAQEIERILKAWNFPDTDRVYFDQANRDIIISGKPRGSRGKGLRAITHAAFIIGILEFCRNHTMSHPGFILLDSPLLAYREPDGTEDDLRGTDVQNKFYEYLAGWNDNQIIIFENVDPPADIKSRASSIFFSQNPHHGRYGLFPAVTTPV